MSWGIRYEAPADETTAATLEALQHLTPPTSGTTNTQLETESQFHAALAAATAIIESGVVGAGPFLVELSGHANEAHTPTPGYSPDSIHVNVYMLA